MFLILFLCRHRVLLQHLAGWCLTLFPCRLIKPILLIDIPSTLLHVTRPKHSLRIHIVQHHPAKLFQRAAVQVIRVWTKVSTQAMCQSSMVTRATWCHTTWMSQPQQHPLIPADFILLILLLQRSYLPWGTSKRRLGGWSLRKSEQSWAFALYWRTDICKVTALRRDSSLMRT